MFLSNLENIWFKVGPDLVHPGPVLVHPGPVLVHPEQLKIWGWTSSGPPWTRSGPPWTSSGPTWNTSRFEVRPDLVQVGPVLVQPNMPFFIKSSILTQGINIFEKNFQGILGKYIFEFWAHKPIFKSQKRCFEVGPDLVHPRVSSTESSLWYLLLR